MNNEARTEQKFVDEHPYITWCDEPNTANDDGYHELPDGSVTTSKLADGAVTGAKMGDESVNAGAIVDGAVTTAKIADGAVTGAKLGDWAVTTSKIADANVTGDKIADGTITADKLAFSPGGSGGYNRFKDKSVVWLGSQSWVIKPQGSTMTMHPDLIADVLGFGSLIVKGKSSIDAAPVNSPYIEGLQEITADTSIDNDSIDYIIIEGIYLERNQTAINLVEFEPDFDALMEYARANFSAEIIFIPAMSTNVPCDCIAANIVNRNCANKWHLPILHGSFLAAYPANLSNWSNITIWSMSWTFPSNQSAQNKIARSLIQGLLTGTCDPINNTHSQRPLFDVPNMASQSSKPASVTTGNFGNYETLNRDYSLDWMLSFETDSTFNEADWVYCYKITTKYSYEYFNQVVSDPVMYASYKDVEVKFVFDTTGACSCQVYFKGSGESHINFNVKLGCIG